MKTRILIFAVSILALLSVCSCSKKESTQQSASKDNSLKTLDDIQGSGMSDADKDALREQAAKQSGNRLNEKIKEAEKAKKTESSKNNSNSNDKNNSTDNNGSRDEPIADSMVSGTGKYSGALNKKELSETLKLAVKYVNKTYATSIKTKDLKPTSDDSKEYSKYPLYGVGNIIIYEYNNNGQIVCIAVGRTNSESDWKVLNKK